MVSASEFARVANVPVVVGSVTVAAPLTRVTAMFPDNVLLVNVSVPVKVAIVPSKSGIVNTRVFAVVTPETLKSTFLVKSVPSVIVTLPDPFGDN